MDYAEVLRTKDQESAKTIQNQIWIFSEIPDPDQPYRARKAVDVHNDISKFIGYPSDNVWKNGEMNPHYRRILVDLKLLAATGNHTHPFYK